MERQKLIIITIVIFVLIVVVIIAYLCVRSKDEFVDGDRPLISTDNKNLNTVDKTSFVKLFFDQLYPPGSIYVSTGNFPGYPFNSSEWEQINSNLLVGADGVGGTTSINEMLGVNIDLNYPLSFAGDSSVGGIVSLNKWKRKCDNCVPTQQKQVNRITINDFYNVSSVVYSTANGDYKGNRLLINDGFWQSGDTYSNSLPVTGGYLANYLICIKDNRPARIYGQYVTINGNTINYSKFFLKTGSTPPPPKEFYIIAKKNTVCYWTILHSETNCQQNEKYYSDLRVRGDFESYGVIVPKSTGTSVSIVNLFFVSGNLIKPKALHSASVLDNNLYMNYSGSAFPERNGRILWKSAADKKGFVAYGSSYVLNTGYYGPYVRADFGTNVVISKIYVHSDPNKGQGDHALTSFSLFGSNDPNQTADLHYFYVNYRIPGDNVRITQKYIDIIPDTIGSFRYYFFQLNAVQCKCSTWGEAYFDFYT